MNSQKIYPKPFPPTLPTVFGSRDFPLGCFFVNGQTDNDLHCHDFDELVIINQGKGVHLTPGGTYPIGKGDVFLIRKGEAHGYKDCINLQLSNIYIDWTALNLPLYDLEQIPGFHALTRLEPLTRERQGFTRRLSLTEEELSHFEESYRQFNKELELQAGGYQFSTASQFMKILLFLSRSFDSREEETVQDLLLLSRLTGVIKENLDKQLTAEMIAAGGNCSVRTVQRVFKRELDCTPIQYVTKQKVRRAKIFLMETGLSIARVGEKCGYGDSNYFSRIFKENTGMSPRDYRKKKET